MMGAMDPFVPGQYVYWITCHLNDKSLGWQLPLVGDGVPVGLGLCSWWWEPSFIPLVFR
jgi:hypothetical protein